MNANLKRVNKHSWISFCGCYLVEAVSWCDMDTIREGEAGYEVKYIPLDNQLLGWVLDFSGAWDLIEEDRGKR